jgi:hypothetical protein
MMSRSIPGWTAKEQVLDVKKLAGIEVVIETDLPKVDEAFSEFFDQVNEARSVRKFKATAAQAKVDILFPSIAKWVNGFGHIEIGDQEGFGFIVRAIDYGGVIFEDDKPDTLAEAMAALEKGLAAHFEREGIE